MNAFKLLSTAGDQTLDLSRGGQLTVGRAVTSDLPIYDPTVSRKHAELALSDKGLRVKDLESSNGTFINGTRIGDWSVATNGDVVTFGRVAFKVVEITPPRPHTALSGAGAAAKPDATIVRQVSVTGPSGAVSNAQIGAQVEAAANDSDVERQARKLHLLLDISQALSRQQDVDTLLEKVVDITFQVMNVDRVSILMVEGEQSDLVPRISRSRLGGNGSLRQVPQSIARRAVTERLAILTDNAADDERFHGQSILVQSVRSAMCTPLLASRDEQTGQEGRVLGIIYVDSQTATKAFSDEDLEFLIAFSGIAAIAIDNSQLIARVQREAIVLSNFQRYFAPKIAEQIAAQEGEIKVGGVRRPAVVFFSDIRGFTPLVERMEPEQIETLLREYFSEMVEIVFKHDGALDKFIGDAIMAQWGAPEAHDDDADRAMRAAIEMQSELARLNVKWAAEGREQLQIGIGITYGEVFFGNIGSQQRLEYTVLGDPVNVAARLCAKAQPGEIIVSEPFYKRLGTPPAVEELQAVNLKGKAEEVRIYRVKR